MDNKSIKDVVVKVAKTLDLREEVVGIQEMVADRLRGNVQCLQGTLMQLLQRLAKEEYDQINGAGELQTLGKYIDMDCARLSTLRQVLKAIDKEPS